MRPLQPYSPRRDAARRFGAALAEAMARRKVSAKTLRPAAGVSTSMITAWRAGQNLPTLRTALRVAEALGTPSLAAIVREARTSPCVVCLTPFLNEGGKPKIYCSDLCREQASRGRARVLEQRREAIDILRGECLRTGPVRKQAIGKALTLLGEAGSDVISERRLTDHRAAVRAMCAGCEPEGYCRDSECPLRAVSPLPLLTGEKETRPVVIPAGRWGPGQRERWSEHMRARWQDPTSAIRLRRGIEAAQEMRRRDPVAFGAAVSRGRRKAS